MSSILFSAHSDIQKLYFSHLSTQDLCSVAVVSKFFRNLVQQVVKERLEQMIQFWENHYLGDGQTLDRAIFQKLKSLKNPMSPRELIPVLQLNRLIWDCIEVKTNKFSIQDKAPGGEWPALIREMENLNSSFYIEGNPSLVLNELKKLGVTLESRDITRFNPVVMYNPIAFRPSSMQGNITVTYIRENEVINSRLFIPSFSYTYLYETAFLGKLPEQKPGPYMSLQEAEEQLKVDHPRPEAEEPPSKSRKSNPKL